MNVQRYELEIYHCNGGEVLVSETGDYVSHDDYAALKAKCAALAAENAGLKELIEQHAGSIAVCPNCSHEEPSETDDIIALYRSMETPATDAFLAGVRAQGGKVTLPTGYSVRPGHPINEAERGVMIPKDNGPWLSRHDVEHVLRVAGIRINGED